MIRNAQNAVDPTEQSTGIISTLTDARLSGSTRWFGIADPEYHSGIDVYVLAGTENKPRLERLTRPPLHAPDGEHFVIGHDVAVLAADYRTLVMNAGA